MYECALDSRINNKKYKLSTTLKTNNEKELLCITYVINILWLNGFFIAFNFWRLFDIENGFKCLKIYYINDKYHINGSMFESIYFLISNKICQYNFFIFIYYIFLIRKPITECIYCCKIVSSNLRSKSCKPTTTSLIWILIGWWFKIDRNDIGCRE